jgi:hypothetical protein
VPPPAFTTFTIVVIVEHGELEVLVLQFHAYALWIIDPPANMLPPMRRTPARAKPKNAEAENF